MSVRSPFMPRLHGRPADAITPSIESAMLFCRAAERSADRQERLEQETLGGCTNYSVPTGGSS
jgi:hypothetical protein